MNMGMAAYEAEEHRRQRIEDDMEVGHKPGCLISFPPPGGGYCNCGLYARGVSQHDPTYKKSESIDDFSFGWHMYFWGFISGMLAILVLLGIMEWIGVI